MAKGSPDKQHELIVIRRLFPKLGSAAAAEVVVSK